jgi:AcrR family transcriptional regulator
MAVPGRRERNATRTRRILTRTAVELFLARGFDGVTVESIAEAAEISPRTTYRYFPTKEDLALGYLADLDDRFLDSVCTRPTDEPPLTSLRRALADTWAWLETSGESETYLALQTFIESRPGLLAANLRRGYQQEELLVAALQPHPAFHPDNDLEARLAVAAFAGASRVALHRWRQSAGTVPMLVQELDTCIATLLPALESAGGQHITTTSPSKNPTRKSRPT